MRMDAWLPRQYLLPDGISVGKPLFCAKDWQITRAGGFNVLLVDTELAERWFDSGLAEESQFNTVTFGPQKYRYLVSEKNYDLAPIELQQNCSDLTDAIAFATSLRESRKIVKDVSFHDSIYVEKYSRLLPTWTLTSPVSDEEVLGFWLTGGVNISTESFRRLCSLLTWLDVDSVLKVIEIAGLSVDEETYTVTFEQQKDDAEIQIDEESPQGKFTTQKNSLAINQKDKAFELPGRPVLEKFFNEQVVDVVFSLDKYKKMGIPFPSAILLYGPPGSGKTYAVEKLAEYLDWPVHSIDSNSIGSIYIHDTSKKIAEVFDKATKTSPSIVIIDEMESYLSSRSFGSNAGLHHVEEVAEFLRRIPEAPQNQVLVFGMTNMIEMIDPAAIRRGRFDHKIEVGMPTRVEVETLLQSIILKLPVAEDLSLDRAVDVLTGKPFSDLAFVLREAGRLAVKNDKNFIDQESIDSALLSIPEEKEESKKIGFDL